MTGTSAFKRELRLREDFAEFSDQNTNETGQTEPMPKGVSRSERVRGPIGLVESLQLQPGSARRSDEVDPGRLPVRNKTRQIRTLPRYEGTISAVLLELKEEMVRPLRPVLRRHDITEPQWRVLHVLHDHGTADAMSLAERCFLHHTSVVRILRELERRRLLDRRPDTADRRRMLVTLTPIGHEIVDPIADEVLRLMGEYAHRFREERLEWLYDELRALSAAIGEVE